MAAGRRLFRRCVNRGPATTHNLARTSEWRRPPQRERRKTARVIPGPASSSTTTETARGSNRGMIGIIPTGRLLRTTTPASRRATCRIIRTGRRLPITPANRRATCRIIRTGRRLPAMRDSRSPMREIIRTSPRLPITPANRRATCRTIRTGPRPPIVAASRPRPISRGIRHQTMPETGRIATVRLVRGRTAQTLCRR